MEILVSKYQAGARPGQSNGLQWFPGDARNAARWSQWPQLDGVVNGIAGKRPRFFPLRCRIAPRPDGCRGPHRFESVPIWRGCFSACRNHSQNRRVNRCRCSCKSIKRMASSLVSGSAGSRLRFNLELADSAIRRGRVRLGGGRSDTAELDSGVVVDGRLERMVFEQWASLLGKMQAAAPRGSARGLRFRGYRRR